MGGLASAAYRVALGKHTLAVLTDATHGHCVCTRGVRGCAGIAAGTPPQSTLLPLIMFFENAAFWVFDAFDGCFESFVSLFGRFSSTMDSKMGFETVPNSDQALNKKSA